MDEEDDAEPVENNPSILRMQLAAALAAAEGYRRERDEARAALGKLLIETHGAREGANQTGAPPTRKDPT